MCTPPGGKFLVLHRLFKTQPVSACFAPQARISGHLVGLGLPDIDYVVSASYFLDIPKAKKVIPIPAHSVLISAYSFPVSIGIGQTLRFLTPWLKTSTFNHTRSPMDSIHLLRFTLCVRVHSNCSSCLRKL
jgi:hypothetical protein